MSKSGKAKKYRWVDEEDDGYDDYKGKKRGKDRRSERRLNSALKSKNYDYLLNNEDDR